MPQFNRAIRCCLALIALLAATPAGRAADDAYREAAVGAARWLQSVAIRTPDGLVWPADPHDAKSVNTTLYAGSPGPVLFFLELYRETRNEEYLRIARAGADALNAGLTRESGSGLYEGIAGIGYTVGEMYLVTHDARYREAALQVVKSLADRAHRTGAGVEWNDTTDIISGSSGTGLFLLWAARELDAPGARELAASAGRRLVEIASRPSDGQLKWMMDRTFPKEMPNFSHGTAGVAYFLATLSEETHDRTFLDAALAGARYVLSVADTDREMCLVYHDDSPAGKRLYYLGWCHGPAGTARLFYRLYQATHEEVWMEWAKKSARALLANGGPERAVTPGAWDNVGVCCGVAAEAEFLLGMYAATGESPYLAAANQASTYLVSKATRDATGARWVQAENRIDPDGRVAQTGYMQGASGIGMWLLHLSQAAERRQGRAITLPDNPFAY